MWLRAQRKFWLLWGWGWCEHDCPMTPAPVDPHVLPHSRAAELLAAGDLEAALETAQAELSALDAEGGDDGRWDGLRAVVLETLGTAQFRLGRAAEAEAALVQAIDRAAVALPVAEVARMRMTMCALLEDAGREVEAMKVYEVAIAAFVAADPPDHLAAARLRNNLALGCKRAGKLALAEQQYLQALEVLESELGKENEEVAALYNNIGSLYYSAGFSQQAKETFEEALGIRMRLTGGHGADVAQSLINLGTAHYELGEDEQAIQSYEKGLAILEEMLPEKARSYLSATEDFIALLGALHKDHEAAALQERRDAKMAAFPLLAEG